MHANIYGAVSFGLCAHKTTRLPYAVFARLASTTSANLDPLNDCNDTSSSTISYPFPKHKHPTPYEIFHLKPGASPGAIKNRYYQLVRLHHPDAPYARKLPTNVSHERFQAIQSAHEALTGKARRRDFPSPMYKPNKARPNHFSSAAHWAQTGAYNHHAHNSHAEWAHAAAGSAFETEDDRAKHRTFLIIGSAAIGLTIIPFLSSSALSDSKHRSAVRNLAEARKEAREVGPSRRAEIRRRVREIELNREYESRRASDGSAGPTHSSPIQ